MYRRFISSDEFTSPSNFEYGDKIFEKSKSKKYLDTLTDYDQIKEVPLPYSYSILL